MPARAKMIDKELENRFSAITWDMFLSTVNACTKVEQDAIIADIINNDGGFRKIIFKNLRQNIKTQVSSDVDGFIASGFIPVSFLNKILD